MNRLTSEQRGRILHLLCEGNSIRAVAWLTGVSKNTVTKLVLDAGRALSMFQDHALRNLSCQRVQCDEIWSFKFVKDDNMRGSRAAPIGAGEVWTWTALCADTKLACSWYIGDRSAHSATQFLTDLRSRLVHSVQLTSVAHNPYPTVISGTVGDDIDYGALQNIYGTSPEGTHRYSRALCWGIIKEQRMGNPEPDDAFSRKIENHACAVALHFAYYNFVRIHKRSRVTPAMAAGITDRLYEINDLVAIVEAAEPKPAKRGPYKIERHG